MTQSKTIQRERNWGLVKNEKESLGFSIHIQPSTAAPNSDSIPSTKFSSPACGSRKNYFCHHFTIFNINWNEILIHLGRRHKHPKCSTLCYSTIFKKIWKNTQYFHFWLHSIQSSNVFCVWNIIYEMRFVKLLKEIDLIIFLQFSSPHEEGANEEVFSVQQKKSGNYRAGETF